MTWRIERLLHLIVYVKMDSSKEIKGVFPVCILVIDVDLKPTVSITITIIVIPPYQWNIIAVDSVINVYTLVKLALLLLIV